MISLFFILNCPITEIVNKTSYEWNKHDQETMIYCQKRCKYYYEDSQCLKKFFKIGKQDYYALCGS